MHLIELSDNKDLKNQAFYHLVDSQDSGINPPKLQDRNISNQLDSGTMLFILWTTVLSFAFLISVRLLEKFETFKIREVPNTSDSDIICRQCVFYTDNKYLNCAVRPEIVLTKKAINCTDYCAREREKIAKNRFS